MNTILLILIFLILGIVFGLIFARLMSWVSNFILKRKVNNQIKTDERKLFYKDKPYDLKTEIEYEKREKASKKKNFNPFKRKQKGGISDYGNTIQPRIRREQVFPSVKGTTEPASSPTNTAESRTAREQEYTNSPNPRGEQRGNFNRNLFEKGK